MPATSAKQAKVESAAEGNKDEARQGALEEIDACQNEIDTLNEKASEEILKVEQKFNNLRKPHYAKRNEFCAKITDFWFTTFTNHPQISALLSDDETECLSYLSNVEVEEFEDIKAGFKITFAFRENPFFKNKKLEKEFHMAASEETQSKSTKIDWKEGKDLTKNGKAETNGNRKRKSDTAESFFSWFVGDVDPSIDEIAEVIKDEVWPNPLQYYLASEFDSAEMGGDSDEDDDEDDDDDEAVVELDDEDDDDEDDDDDVQEVDDDDDEEDSKDVEDEEDD